MTPAPTVGKAHPAIKAYHAALATYAAAGATHEGALRTAFGNLLDAVAKPHGWTLIPEKRLAVGAKTYIYPDGTLEDVYHLSRGYWEAKDTADDLATEIKRKIAKKYPLTNTIFEDTRRAVLYQHAKPAGDFDLTDPQHVADLLTQFAAYAEPNIVGFNAAVTVFADRVPDLARGLATAITRAHADNPAFQAAFGKFFALCQSALNPAISRPAVDEMLAQHLLTERLFRKLFAAVDFTKQNAIAAEVETVIAALTSKSFSRDEFLKTLDPFFKAIEAAAETVTEYADKQHFLNTVYERFFQGYSVKEADTHGVVYTPQPVVDFMCASVEEVLKSEFGLTLGSKEVRVLDPCTGTGNFAVNLLRRVPKADVRRFYREQLFANEVMLLPYYIAALNIEHAFLELTGGYEPFDGLCFVDTLDLANKRQPTFDDLSHKNAERVEREKFALVNVIVGNPPYNVGQTNENDDNKNRKYEAIDQRVRETYAKASKATSVSKLNDPYVKFFRWATDRLGKRDGVVCFVSNNSFLEQIAFDGMRQHLFKDFTRVHHYHLEGNVRQNPELSGTQYNVFGIQVGVGITIAVRSAKHADRQLWFHRIDKLLRRKDKLAALTTAATMSGVPWQQLTPDDDANWLIPENAVEFKSFLAVGSKAAKKAKPGKAQAVFKDYSLGVATHRDSVVYGFDRAQLATRVEAFCEAYNAEVDRYNRLGEKPDFKWGDKVVWDRDLKQDAVRGKNAVYDSTKLRLVVYRPFSLRWLYFDRLLNAEIYSLENHYPASSNETDNRSICLTTLGSEKPFLTLMTPGLVDLHLVGAGCGTQCFPFYVYTADGTRTENVTDWALKQFKARYKGQKLTKWDIFHYVYAVLHHPDYRTRFADSLKKSLPRIPFAPDFRAFAAAGKTLADLHVGFETADPYPLDEQTNDQPLTYRIDKMALSKDKTAVVVNDSLTLAGLPPATLAYRLGNRSAVEWVIDQYRVSADKRSGIVSDPNRPDDERFVVELLKRVVMVSVRTTELVNGLPRITPPAPPG